MTDDYLKNRPESKCQMTRINEQRIKAYQKRLARSEHADAHPDSIAIRAKRGLIYKAWLAKPENSRPPLATHMILGHPRRLKLIRGGRA